MTYVWIACGGLPMASTKNWGGLQAMLASSSKAPAKSAPAGRFCPRPKFRSAPDARGSDNAAIPGGYQHCQAHSYAAQGQNYGYIFTHEEEFPLHFNQAIQR